MLSTTLGFAQNVPQKESPRGKQSEDEKEKQARRARDIHNLVSEAQALPAEIATDLLFEILRANLVAEREQKKQILEGIFYRASEAREPLKRIQREGLIDTRPGYQTIAFDQQLDALSIRLRAIRLIMALDKQRARALFLEMPPLRPVTTSCEDALDYDVSDFYVLLKELVEQTFDPEAKRRLEPGHFAANYVGEMSSPSQVRPVVVFLSSLKSSPTEFQMLVNEFSSALKKVALDPRSFSNSLRYGGLTNGIKSSLLPKVEQLGGSSDYVLRSCRSYFARQLSSTQCRDALMIGTGEQLHPLVAEANLLFRPPLESTEVKPERIESGAKVFAYWQSPKAAKLLAGVKKLRFGEGRLELTREERLKPEWQQELMRFLDEMNAWRPEDEETESDYLHQRGVLYYALIELAPPGVLRRSVLRDYAMFLRDSKMWKESPAEWLVYGKYILRFGKTLQGKDFDDFREVVSGAGNQVLPLYFELERLRSATPGK